MGWAGAGHGPRVCTSVYMYGTGTYDMCTDTHTVPVLPVVPVLQYNWECCESCYERKYSGYPLSSLVQKRGEMSI